MKIKCKENSVKLCHYYSVQQIPRLIEKSIQTASDHSSLKTSLLLVLAAVAAAPVWLGKELQLAAKLGAEVG